MKIIVKANPNTNLIITPSTKSPEWGTIRLECTALEATNGMLNSRKRVAFLRAKIEDLESLALKDNMVFPLQGRIVVKESTTPFYDGQAPKINPSTGEILNSGGAPIYRITEFTSNLSEQDVFLAHDKDIIDTVEVIASTDETAQ